MKETFYGTHQEFLLRFFPPQFSILLSQLLIQFEALKFSHNLEALVKEELGKEAGCTFVPACIVLC